MTISDLIFAAGNVLESAFLEEAEVSSQVIQGQGVKIEHRKINLKKALEKDPEHNLPLRPYDRLYVKRIAEWRKENFVTLTGEVKLAGKYSTTEEGFRMLFFSFFQAFFSSSHCSEKRTGRRLYL